jgi:hypothetical protein
MTITLTREEAQQVLDALINAKGYIFYNVLDDKGNRYDAAAELLRTRLAQPEPEPVADKYLMEVECTKCGAKQDGILTVTAPPQRVYCSCGDGIVPDDGALCGTCVSLKDKREWQSLTYKEIGVVIGDCNITLVNYCSEEKQTEFARAIEDKLKAKNSA